MVEGNQRLEQLAHRSRVQAACSVQATVAAWRRPTATKVAFAFAAAIPRAPQGIPFKGIGKHGSSNGAVTSSMRTTAMGRVCATRATPTQDAEDAEDGDAFSWTVVPVIPLVLLVQVSRG